LSELTFLQASRRAAAAVHPHSQSGGGAGLPHTGGGADFHPAYRLNPYMEHLYGSLHAAAAAAAAGSPGSPSASLRGLSPLDSRGQYSTFSFRLHKFNSIVVFFNIFRATTFMSSNKLLKK
jgi:hypothetical protein